MLHKNKKYFVVLFIILATSFFACAINKTNDYRIGLESRNFIYFKVNDDSKHRDIDFLFYIDNLEEKKIHIDFYIGE